MCSSDLIYPPFAIGALLGTGAYVGQIRAGARLGVALAPELGTGADARQVALFLFFTAEGNQRRAGQAFTDMPDPSRATGTGVFFKKDHLLLDARTPSAGFLGPADTGLDVHLA